MAHEAARIRAFAEHCKAEGAAVSAGDLPGAPWHAFLCSMLCCIMTQAVGQQQGVPLLAAFSFVQPLA